MATETSLPSQSAPGDGALIAAARHGDEPAFLSLIARHTDAGARLARKLAPTAPTDLLTEAIEAVAAGLRAGTGPRLAFRPHLLTAVHRAHAERGKSNGRVHAVEPATGPILVDSVIDARLLAAAARAYRGLPESQQVALWHTEVDGEPLLDTGALLGVSGTEVAELAFAGREALRAALLDPHLEKITTGPCRWTTDRLGAHVRGRLSTADAQKVVTHLEHCASCRAMLPAVHAIEIELRALVALIVLGTAAGPYLGVETTAAARRRAGAGAVLVRAPGYVLAHGKAIAVVGLGAALMVAGLVGGLRMLDDDGSTATARGPATFTMVPEQAKTTDVGQVEVAAAGSGVGYGLSENNAAAAGRAPGSATPPQPRPLLASSGSITCCWGSTSHPAPKDPAKPAGDVVHLGVADLRITPDGGMLGIDSLPGISVDPPSWVDHWVD